MKITKDSFDGEYKSGTTKGMGKKIFIYLLLIYAFALVAAIIFAFQEENTVEHYFLYGFVSKVIPSLSLLMYKLVVSVFSCSVIYGIFISGKKIKKKVDTNKVSYKITFDEEKTQKRFSRLLVGRIAVLNLLFSGIVALFIYNKVIESTNFETSTILSIFTCGIIFCVLLFLFCKYGYIVERFLINPFIALLNYVFYLAFLIWLFILLLPSALVLLSEMLASILYVFVAASVVYIWWSFCGWYYWE